MLPQVALGAVALASLETALLAYDDVRQALVSDDLKATSGPALRTAQALKAALQDRALPTPVQEVLEHGQEAAAQLGRADSLAAARVQFSDLSRALIALLGSDARLAAGRQLFSCPMVDGYGYWLQTDQALANPYMGQQMLTCGSSESLSEHLQAAAAEPMAGDEATHARAGSDHADSAAAGGDEVAYYTCPMHPSVRQPTPGQCPICSMDLTPVTQAEVSSGVILVDAARRQLIGVKLATVERRVVDQELRAVGTITYDETRIVDVTVKFEGFINQLFADATGKRVKRGHALFTVYSPEIYQAQQDLLIARGPAASDAGPPGAGSAAFGASFSGPLQAAAKRRLQLLDVTGGTIQRVIERGEPLRYIPIVSPATGYIVDKRVFEGSAVTPGMPLMRIANLDKVWIETELHEAELSLVKKGDGAEISLPYLPKRSFSGKVSFVYPYLSPASRTGKVRIELDNREVELKPDMYANVTLQLKRGARLVIPVSAVIYAGPRRLVFIDLGGGRLRPQEVTLGPKLGESYEVLSGLKAGQSVVSSGNFLIAAESRLKSAEGQW